MGKPLCTNILLILTASYCFGHIGDRVVPIPEIPEELITQIDIKDGDIEDWLNVIGEPSLTGLDLIPNFGDGWGEEYNPGDLDFRIWMGWHRGMNRIYLAGQGVDDVLVDQSDGVWDDWYWDGMMRLEIDGDHSGGIFVWDEDEDVGLTTWWEGVQFFSVGALNYRRNPFVHMLFPNPPEDCCWFSRPPFADMGAEVNGEKPSVWVMETYITPFDRLVFESREETVISELEPNKIVGLRITVTDLDDPERQIGYDGLYSIPPIESQPNPGPDFFADGILLPTDKRENAVESVSWGRIKASLLP